MTWIQREFGKQLNGMWNDNLNIKCKFILKIKRNEIFRARLVARRYSQVLGVDFSKKFAHVVNDTTFRII
jgi:hypothetical protein